MASKIKIDNVQKLLNAATETINDLLKENFELKRQMHLLISGQYENRENSRRTLDYSK